MKHTDYPLTVVVPAAGVGKRMQASCPKQYLQIGQLSILEHTVLRLLAHPQIEQVIIALSDEDEYFSQTQLFDHSNVRIVTGGKERVDSVLAGLKAIDRERYPWVLVHDAARPCVSLEDLQRLIDSCLTKNIGAILATPVRDTMKRGQQGLIEQTVEREQLWHALTPQMFPTQGLLSAIEDALSQHAVVTDEASAIELIGGQCQLVEGSSDNIKITRPDDLALAEFILSRQQNIINTQANNSESSCE